jgi:hypothetical protein
LELFFTHTQPAMRNMGLLLRQGKAPSNVMALLAAEDERRDPYAPCPCGGGKKFRFCHGDREPKSNFSGLDRVVNTSGALGSRAIPETNQQPSVLGAKSG